MELKDEPRKETWDELERDAQEKKRKAFCYIPPKTNVIYQPAKQAEKGIKQYVFFWKNGDKLWERAEYQEDTSSRQPPRITRINLGSLLAHTDLDKFAPVFNTGYLLNELEQRLEQKQWEIRDSSEEEKQPYALAFDWLADAKRAIGF